MLAVSAQSLYDSLRRLDGDIEKQILQLRKNCEYGVELHQLQNADGSYVLIPLLVAKANCLNGMAILKAADMKPRKGW